jgi:hypothetical protein
VLRDRFLTGILLGIGVLIAAALILFFVRESQVRYQDETTPEGVLHNYFLALQRREYDRAYGYLADLPEKPDRLRFEQTFLGFQGDEVSRTSVELLSVRAGAASESVMVDLTLLSGRGDIFSGSAQQREGALLVQQNGNWKVSSAPYPYWDYNWPAPLR